jgi:hypothetical protein
LPATTDLPPVARERRSSGGRLDSAGGSQQDFALAVFEEVTAMSAIARVEAIV